MAFRQRGRYPGTVTSVTEIEEFKLVSRMFQGKRFDTTEIDTNTTNVEERKVGRLK